MSAIGGKADMTFALMSAFDPKRTWGHFQFRRSLPNCESPIVVAISKKIIMSFKFSSIRATMEALPSFFREIENIGGPYLRM